MRRTNRLQPRLATALAVMILAACSQQGAKKGGTLAEDRSHSLPSTALDQDVREHFDRLYEALWRQVLGGVDYRARLAAGRMNADAFAEAQGMRSRMKKRAQEQKEILNICSFEADRANFGAARVQAASSPSPQADGVPQ